MKVGNKSTTSNNSVRLNSLLVEKLMNAIRIEYIDAVIEKFNNTDDFDYGYYENIDASLAESSLTNFGFLPSCKKYFGSYSIKNGI